VKAPWRSRSFIAILRIALDTRLLSPFRPKAAPVKPPQSRSHNLGLAFPARRLLDLIAHKWTPIVIYYLSGNPVRFGELHRNIPGISKKMLIQVLRQLEADGLVNRKVYETIPPRTEYNLTTTGNLVQEPIAIICLWAIRNEALLEQIEQKRIAEWKKAIKIQ
jgi:DNA-binding HxlR family transcriptional regulator